SEHACIGQRPHYTTEQRNAGGEKVGGACDRLHSDSFEYMGPIVTEHPHEGVRKAKRSREQMQCQGPNCTREIEQIPGSHRPRIYCSDRCRMAARRQRMRGSEQAQIKQAEALTRKVRERMARRFGLLTEDSLDLLVELGHRE